MPLTLVTILPWKPYLSVKSIMRRSITVDFLWKLLELNSTIVMSFSGQIQKPHNGAI